MNFFPSNLGGGLVFRRSRNTEQSRHILFASPVVRDFSADRELNFTWRFSQGGFLSPTFDYSFVTKSTLLSHELDQFGAQRNGSEIYDQMFFKDGFIDFGDNTQHNQTVNINFKPVLQI